MNVFVILEPALDACTITHDAVHLRTPEDIAKWEELLFGKMEKMVGNRRVYLLVDFTDFSVAAGLAHEYGRVAEELRRRFAKDVFRYGASDPHSALSARLQSLKRAHLSNIFETREEAVATLERFLKDE